MPDNGNGKGKGKGKDKESRMDGLDSDNPCVSSSHSHLPSSCLCLFPPLLFLLPPPSFPLSTSPFPPSPSLVTFNQKHPRACALQSCMQRTWDQDKCSAELRALYLCCSRLYQTKGTTGPKGERTEVDACPLPEVLRGKLRGLGEEANF
ncbi:hypothetical protein BCV69DRAFT_133567 [Microstroma glucosiphilum]|uniref:Cx9C motif-containing protein 4, mitochondrial n=1 Tax=Pseudomicrostroma glucosiphilum TaxID=1684307 RepID=A0A316UB89_9BASI|nr:hypothetical protein BCV69DRAFT_133567 [Pseudomicrostroma glucosiphilum]PWN22128.1 hypothetical protein BCV69DRAFT_133567 [Pseudomicrostroma glucosiphilum]